MKTLSPRIKAIKSEIDRQRISVTDLAYTCKISFSTLYRMLGGETDPTLSNVEELEKILRISYKRIDR
jgi:ribosome-binding protein aMBF1 (putative translation factor)